MISRVRIEHFRSIKKIGFTPPRLCTLVGANSVEKSNILKALDTLLGETYPGDRAFNKDDFYNRDTNREIKLVFGLIYRCLLAVVKAKKVARMNI